MKKERKFELPGFQDLSKEQDDALALPKNGVHLVVGGPGTGKSVVVLLRARRQEREKDDYVFLVYNHALHKACCDLIGTNINSMTWNQWFGKLYYRLAGKPLPFLDPEPDKTWRPIDWRKVLDEIQRNDNMQIKNPPAVLIDEGQDMPPEFYASLVNMGFDRFFIVADQNQQIDPEDNSSRQDIEDNLDIETDEVIELTYNYRNTLEIARLAGHFYTDRATPRPALPEGRKSAKNPLLFEYGDDQASYGSLIRRIVKTADVRPNRLIGIICPNNDTRKKYYHSLKKAVSQMRLDNGTPNIDTYSHGNDVSIHFDMGGIVVINLQSCKGLEFDFVFLADVDQYDCQADNPDSIDQMKKNFYVMVARAKEHLVMLKKKGSYCPVQEHILPEDESILARESQHG